MCCKFAAGSLGCSAGLLSVAGPYQPPDAVLVRLELVGGRGVVGGVVGGVGGLLPAVPFAHVGCGMGAWGVAG